VEDKVPNAFATPNGIVVIHTGLFDVVENEAQLAAVVGHEISHAVQEHTWRQHEYQKTTRTALLIGAAVAAAYGQAGLWNIAELTEAAIRNGYSRNLENQADRLGMAYMVDAGYDPREAPRVWKQMVKKVGEAPTDFFWSNHDNASTRRSYLMNELKNNYAELHYSELQSDSLAFHEIAAKIDAITRKKDRR
jgi:predicted Zn-dependent protease